MPRATDEKRPARVARAEFVGTLRVQQSRAEYRCPVGDFSEDRLVERRDHRDGSGLPRWPAAVVLLAIGALYAVISDGLTLGPRAFLLGLVAVALVPLMTAHLRGSHRLARWFGLGVVGLVTLAVVVSAFLLVSSALGRGASAPALLRDATLLWVINVATFAVWYWEIDGGDPASRRTEGHRSDDFLFPQANLATGAARAWHPGFVDYVTGSTLFVDGGMIRHAGSL